MAEAETTNIVVNYQQAEEIVGNINKLNTDIDTAFGTNGTTTSTANATASKLGIKYFKSIGEFVDKVTGKITKNTGIATQYLQEMVANGEGVNPDDTGDPGKGGNGADPEDKDIDPKAKADELVEKGLIGEDTRDMINDTVDKADR